MRKLSVFNQVTLDGYFVDGSGDMRWAHKDRSDAEWNEFVAGNASGDSVLVFGRVTYEMMASYWPTPLALQNDPVVTARMNSLQKIVFSKTLEAASWSNTTLLKEQPVGEMRRLKSEPGPPMVILGSGSIVSQLAQAELIDEYQLVLNPLALGSGRTLFAGGQKQLSFSLTQTRTFKNGNVLLCYAPA